jgi:hypothetical protein
MICNGNLKKIFYFCSFRSKAEKHHVFAFTYVLESFALHDGGFCIDFYNVDSDEAVKRAMKRLPLHRFNF